jgi:hypothetical protein
MRGSLDQCLMPLKSTLALCLPGIGLAQANSSDL